MKDSTYELHDGYSPETRGVYIHPNLIHIVAEYSCSEYPFKELNDLKLENSDLKERAVPRKYKHNYSYLIYEDEDTEEEDVDEGSITVVCRRYRSKDKRFEAIVEAGEYLVHHINLPISMTINETIFDALKTQRNFPVKILNYYRANFKNEYRINFINFVEVIIERLKQNTYP
jgi:hypothetical protein